MVASLPTSPESYRTVDGLLVFVGPRPRLHGSGSLIHPGACLRSLAGRPRSPTYASCAVHAGAGAWRTRAGELGKPWSHCLLAWAVRTLRTVARGAPTPARAVAAGGVGHSGECTFLRWSCSPSFVVVRGVGGTYIFVGMHIYIRRDAKQDLGIFCCMTNYLLRLVVVDLLKSL
ncbi:serrate RNA effector molecule homolog [Striga asiatica]|uniref:Serrate RNA effector molecule homolog n=1 Tax=Striga asiatica TaxID=4170 RepID=A0A5A7PHS9_STRAF|nr:serrate RNA effector molecule homolog [Striga asiatica]